MSRHLPQRLSRRTALTGIATLGVASTPRPARLAAQTPVATTVPTAATLSGTSLSVLQGQHPMPGYDSWFEQFLYDWAAANGVQARLTRRITAEIPGVLAAEIETGSGHDIVEYVSPLPQFEASLLDLTGLEAEAIARFGPQLAMGRAQTFNPVTGKLFGLCHGYAPFPGIYRQSMWSAAGLEAGPAFHEDLVNVGGLIWDTQGVPVGLGISPEIESNLGMLGMIWAFGGSVQDERGVVTLNSPETLAAVTQFITLYQRAMLPEVLDWSSETNDRSFLNGRLSFTQNPVSSYRSFQQQRVEVADDLSFRGPLIGPAGQERALAANRAAYTVMVPAHAAYPETAMAFVLHLISSYEGALNASELSQFPTFPQSVPMLTADGGLLDADPFGSAPPTKLAVLKGAADWTVNIGWPGPTNAMMVECVETSILSNMVASAARGEMSPEAAIADAEAKLNAIADTWRGRGLM